MKKTDFSYLFSNQASCPKFESDFLYPVSIGGTPISSGYFSAPEPLTEYLLTLIIDGEYEYSNGKSRIVNQIASKNALLIYHPGDIFAIKPLVPNCYRIWLHVTGKMIPVILQDLNLYKNHFYLLPDNSAFNAIAKFEQLRDASFSETNDHTFIVYRTLAFLDQFNQNAHIQNFLLTKSLDKAMTYINEHYESKISINQLAGICNLSETYFTKSFKTKYGKTPHQLILERRFSKATHYLRFSDTSINDIATICGFNDRVHFSQAFKKEFGVTPYKFRSSNTKSNS